MAKQLILILMRFFCHILTKQKQVNSMPIYLAHARHTTDKREKCLAQIVYTEKMFELLDKKRINTHIGSSQSWSKSIFYNNDKMKYADLSIILWTVFFVEFYCTWQFRLVWQPAAQMSFLYLLLAHTVASLLQLFSPNSLNEQSNKKESNAYWVPSDFSRLTFALNTKSYSKLMLMDYMMTFNSEQWLDPRQIKMCGTRRKRKVTTQKENVCEL